MAAVSAAPSAVYWVGTDGNVWAKGITGQPGVVNLGGVTSGIGKSGNYNLSNNGFESNQLGQSVEATRIADPDPGGSVNQSSDVNTTGTADAPASSSSGSGTTYEDKSNDIGEQQAGLNAVGATQTSGLSAIQQALASIMGEYNTDDTNASSEYGNETTANDQDLQGNKQTALEDAVQGKQGLDSTLASLGALSGTGVELANNAVVKGANEDMTTAGDTYATNQNALDSGYNAFTSQDATRKQEANAAATNDEEQVQNDAYKAEQTYLNNIANDYEEEGNTSQAKNYTDQASALFPQIASTNVPTIDLGYSGSAYTAPTLASYVGSANNTSVQATPASSGAGNNALAIPGIIATNKKQSATTGVAV